MSSGLGLGTEWVATRCPLNYPAGIEPEQPRPDFGQNEMNSSRPNSLDHRPHHSVRQWLLIVLLLAPSVLDAAMGEVCLLSSPDGRIQVSVQMPAPGSVARPHWSATFRGKPVLTECGLGLQTAEAGDVMAGVRVVAERRRSRDARIPVLFGKSDHANDRFREARYTLESPQHRRVDVVFRCYDDAESDLNHLTTETRNLSSADTLKLHLALDGGFVAQLAPAK